MDSAEPNEYRTSVRPIIAERKPGNQSLRHQKRFNREALRLNTIPGMVPI